MSRYIPTYVHDPLYDTFDIAPILPLVNTPEFQALAEKRQLGMTYLVYRNARHTRFEHSLGAYRGTRILTNRLFVDGQISKVEQQGLCVYAALHDLGHPAFSHVTEDFLKLDDDERTLELVQDRVRAAVAACDVDPSFIGDLVSHRNPLWRIVHDKNLGTEKLDYLERDGLSVGFGRPPALGAMKNMVSYVDGHVAIDEKAVDHAIDVMTFYMKMYKEVYFRKALVIAQRMFQKAVYQLICTGELEAESLYDMTDAELIGRLSLSKDPVVASLYGQIRNRSLFKEAVVIRTERFVCETRIAGKPIAVRGVDSQQMLKLVDSPSLQKKSHKKLEELEAMIEAATGLLPGSVLFVSVFNPERFKAQDVMICRSGGHLHSLRERRQAHFASMEETARAYSAVRICTRPEYREKLSRAADVVLELVLAFE